MSVSFLSFFKLHISVLSLFYFLYFVIFKNVKGSTKEEWVSSLEEGIKQKTLRVAFEGLPLVMVQIEEGEGPTRKRGLLGSRRAERVERARRDFLERSGVAWSCYTCSQGIWKSSWGEVGPAGWSEGTFCGIVRAKA